MQTIRRIIVRTIEQLIVRLIELFAEAVLLGCLLALLLSFTPPFLDTVMPFIIAVPTMLFLHWYYLTRGLAAIAPRSQKPWLYPAIAATLFVVHMHIIFMRLEPMTPLAQAIELPYLALGACIVFACALGGNWRLGKRTHDRQERAGLAVSNGLAGSGGDATGAVPDR